MQVMFVLGFEHCLCAQDEQLSKEVVRIGLQDDMTFIGPVAKLEEHWDSLQAALARAGHRLRGYKCGLWAPGCAHGRALAALPEAGGRRPAQRGWCRVARF